MINPSTNHAQKEQKINVNDVIDRLLLVCGAKNDTDYAVLRNLPRSTVGNWRRRQSVPYTECEYMFTEFGVSFDWILTGKGEKYHQTTPLSSDCFSIKPDMRAELGRLAIANDRSLQAQIGAMLEIALRERTTFPPESRKMSFSNYFKNVKANIDPEVRLRLEGYSYANGRTLAEEIAIRLEKSLRDEDEQSRGVSELLAPRPLPITISSNSSTAEHSELSASQAFNDAPKDLPHNPDPPVLAHLKDLIREVTQKTIAIEMQQIHKALLDAGITVQKGKRQK